jgi:predicted DNA-binding mobile mystery protein A
MKTNKLALKQLDQKLASWKPAKSLFQPKDGWIRLIRKTLGMTTNQLAKRLEVDRSRIVRIEADETKNALTMKTLISIAHALNCDFVYAFIPQKPLKKMVEEQAYKIAISQVNNVSHNMLLEKQMLLLKQNTKQAKELQSRLLEKSFKKLWNS